MVREDQFEVFHSYQTWRASFSFDYDATSWLRFSVRAIGSAIDRRQQEYSFYTPSNYSHDRTLVNAFATFNKEIVNKLWLTASTGVQKDKGEGIYNYNLKSQVNTLSLRYNNGIFVDGSYRTDNGKSTWMGAAGWVFSDLFATSHSLLNYAKLRGSAAGYQNSTIQYYPEIAQYSTFTFHISR